MLLQAEAEMFPALLEVFTPPLPTHITLFFLGINVRNGQQNTRLLHAAEIAHASDRLIGIALGAEDYVTDLKTTRIVGERFI